MAAILHFVRVTSREKSVANARAETLGGPETYNHYPTGWAVAFSTPFQMFKRYSQYSDGTCDPLVICWPKGIKAKGEVRNQSHHSTDVEIKDHTSGVIFAYGSRFGGHTLFIKDRKLHYVYNFLR